MNTIGVGEIVITKEDKAAVNKVLDSNRLSYGDTTKKFESLFAKMHGCRFGIFTNSGTSSLQIALAAMKEYYKWDEGDEVLVPATTFVATANIVIYNGLRPVFVDVKLDTFNIDPEDIEYKITPRTRAIIPVHLLGLPCDMERIMVIAKKHDLLVLEDSAECMFTGVNGKRVGSFGAVGCFSTYAAHILVTGVGGMCITSDPELAVIIRSLANHGRDAIYFEPKGDKNEIIARRFKFVRHGHSFRCTEIEAALGLSQLDRIGMNIMNRRNIAADYRAGLADLSRYLDFQESRNNAYMMFGMVLKTGQKMALVNYLEARGIETRDLLPLCTQPIYKEYFLDREADFPVASYLADNAFYIGCHQYLKDADVKYVIKVFHDYFRVRR